MSNDPRPVAKPPLPLLKRSRSGTVPVTRRDRESVVGGRKPSETGRSGSMAAVRPAPAAAVPRPTNVLRRLDPAFTPDDHSESWEPRGTVMGGSYRESLPTVPSPEVLEARLLAELAEVEPQPSPVPVEVESPSAGARAHFEPAHAPAVRVSPIVELDKAVAVIVDPLAIAGGLAADLEPHEDYVPASALLLAKADAVAPPDEVAPATEADVAIAAPLGDSEPELEAGERSRITLPPARRRRRGPRRALLLGVVVLGAVTGAGWYRYPAQYEQGWQQAHAELASGWNALQQWLAGQRALGR